MVLVLLPVFFYLKRREKVEALFVLLPVFSFWGVI